MTELKDKDVEQVVGGDDTQKSAGTAGYFVDPPTPEMTNGWFVDILKKAPQQAKKILTSGLDD